MKKRVRFKDVEFRIYHMNNHRSDNYDRFKRSWFLAWRNGFRLLDDRKTHYELVRIVPFNLYTSKLFGNEGIVVWRHIKWKAAFPELSTFQGQLPDIWKKTNAKQLEIKNVRQLKPWMYRI